jgi:virginiamycin A acetyltransferase
MNRELIESAVSRPDPGKIYPRTGDKTICYLKNVIKNPNISVGDFTVYHDFDDPTRFESRNVLYHYPINHDRLIIGKFCSIACGSKFILNGANHKLQSYNNYPFPVFAEEWESGQIVCEAWDNKGDIVIGHDVWIGFEAMVMAGVHIGDGAIIAARSIVQKDVPPFTIVGGIPARIIRKRFDDPVIELLQQIKWWDWDIQRIKAHIRILCHGNVEELKNALQSER